MVIRRIAHALLIATFLAMAQSALAESAGTVSNLYQEALRLYWKEDNIGAAEKFIQIAYQDTETAESKRAA